MDKKIYLTISISTVRGSCCIIILNRVNMLSKNRQTHTHIDGGSWDLHLLVALLR